MPSTSRDHLFISYAWEDGALAEWLVRKLTAAGYRVWCDRFKLLGGEPWPKDIDHAIKHRTFRMLALISRNSLAKPNPTKERQLGLALTRERGEADFLIPLNLEGLSPAELDWQLTDLTWIPFERWGDGFLRLSDKLTSIGAPRPIAAEGPAAAIATYFPQGIVREESERVTSNCLLVTAIPSRIRRFRLSRPLLGPERFSLADQWAFEGARGSTTLHAFGAPPPSAVSDVDYSITPAGEVSWADIERVDGIATTHLVRALVRKSLVVACLTRGMVRHGLTLYIPKGAAAKDRISYTNYRGRRTYLSVLGERRFGKGRLRYNLGVEFWVRDDVREGELVVQTKVRVHVTDPAQPEKRLDGRATLARRKRVTKSWWNHEWIGRQMALAQFLSNGAADIAIGEGEEQVRIAAAGFSALVSPSIIDAALSPLKRKVDAIRAILPGDDIDLGEGEDGQKATGEGSE